MDCLHVAFDFRKGCTKRTAVRPISVFIGCRSPLWRPLVEANYLDFEQSDSDTDAFDTSDFDVLVYSHVLLDFEPHQGFQAYFDAVLGGGRSKIVIIVDRYWTGAAALYNYEYKPTQEQEYSKSNQIITLPDGKLSMCVVHTVVAKPPRLTDADQLATRIQAMGIA